MLSVVETFLELGDATSHNLKYSHRKNVHVSYGEETITESNLLEIRRRNHDVVQLQTFTKHEESQVGADWEWHIVGKLFTFKMRVQAKRIRSDGKLIIKHYVKSQGEEQRTLLLDGAKSEGMRPAYCFYCTDKQRNKWKQKIPALGLEHYHYGCLIADARKISLETKGLKDIEDECIPWHFLFQETEFAKPKSLYIPLAADVVENLNHGSPLGRVR